MRIADTSALLALFNTADTHHAKARKAFEDPTTAVVPSEVLVELLDLLHSRRGSDPAVAVGQFLWTHPTLELQPSDTQILMTAWGEYEANHRKLSFTDCIVVAWCREHDAQPLSYDKALLRAVRA